jgi:hypothetical protein
MLASLRLAQPERCFALDSDVTAQRKSYEAWIVVRFVHDTVWHSLCHHSSGVRDPALASGLWSLEWEAGTRLDCNGSHLVRFRVCFAACQVFALLGNYSEIELN